MNLLKFGTDEHIPWGDIDFLTKIEDLTLLPRAHVRKHLQARSEAATGQRLEMCQRLQESIIRELKEIKRRKKEKEKRLKEIASKEEKGAIYCVGSNHRGQLGLGDLEDRNNFTVIPMSRGLCFQKVFTRNDLVFAITDSYSVYSWGSNGMGPMAISCEQHELRSNFHTPQLVKSLEEENILGIAVGRLHVCAFNDISIYSWGYNPCGWQEEQQGDDECDRTMRVLPDLIPNSTKEKIIDVASGGMHFCLLTQNGNLCTWGKSSNGNLGHQGLKSEFVPVPRHLYLPVPIRKISCGSEHTMASSEFKVYTWGSNDGARLGLGDFEDREVPYEIVALSGLEILDISCGTWHNACIARQRPSAAEQQEEADDDIRGGWLFTW
jgi:alpha-tubulin suppressor-like RCC1 family protein